ncbi:hypothetical protein tb265_45770 [Gemmatimonadetes bacterium T265]|nr:hypothetical protein tb265_45070 [Gemmatimonadetes bacterium T265]GJG89396.1 hypothetical protein tb265_45770 [Gemmatimonadetes bacterium T265]
MHEPTPPASPPTVLVATWDDGLFVVSAGTVLHELPGHAVSTLAPDGRGGALAIVDGRSLRRRRAAGAWHPITGAAPEGACCVAVGDVVYVGTHDAAVLRVRADGTDAAIERLRGFEQVAGRDHWYAGAAVIDGRRVGPPLGVRSMAVTCDGTVLLANVHVGGIPRSLDGGATWQPTIAIDTDVHEVRAHPTRANLVAAAAGAGLCLSHDGGATWACTDAGLHAPACFAVAFAGDDVLVSAAEGPFAPRGAVYRRAVDDPGPLVRVAGGLPAWLAGGVDTACLAVNGPAIAVADRQGTLYVSPDMGRTWSRAADGLPTPSSVVIV